MKVFKAFTKLASEVWQELTEIGICGLETLLGEGQEVMSDERA